MTIWAIIKSQIEGIHFWKDAPKEVEFLKYPHRHIFYVELWIEQKHQERDVEYIQEKRRLNEFLEHYKEECKEGFSCENLASDLSYWAGLYYSGRKIKAFVFEDNENGCCYE